MILASPSVLSSSRKGPGPSHSLCVAFPQTWDDESKFLQRNHILGTNFWRRFAVSTSPV